MIIIRNESDFRNLRAEWRHSKVILDYIHKYFDGFAIDKNGELSIEDVGLIAILDKGDKDIFCPEMLLPSFFRSVPEETTLIRLNTSEGETTELFHALFLPNNEMGIDIFCVKDYVSVEIKNVLLKEFDNNAGGK